MIVGHGGYRDSVAEEQRMEVVVGLDEVGSSSEARRESGIQEAAECLSRETGG
jgi:hypothetical protein